MKFKPKDWVMIAIVAVALVVFAYAIVRQREGLGMREGFTDPGSWTGDDGTLNTVAITEDGTLWGTAPESAGQGIWRKLKGGVWTNVKGTAKQISAKDANNAVVVGTDNGLYQTTDGGQTWNMMGGGHGKWISQSAEGTVMCIDMSNLVYVWDSPNNRWFIPQYGGQGTQVTLASIYGMAQVIGMDGVIYELSGKGGWDGYHWVSTGAPSKNVAMARDGLSVEVSTDGNVYWKTPGKPYVKFEGANIRQLSASTTKLACVTNDNKVWTKDISGAAPAAAPPPPPAAGPSPSAAPGLTAGNYAASCSRCQVVNNQITCACDVQPK